MIDQTHIQPKLSYNRAVIMIVYTFSYNSLFLKVLRATALDSPSPIQYDMPIDNLQYIYRRMPHRARK